MEACIYGCLPDLRGSAVSHSHHEALPRYTPDAVFQDGCGECEQRGALPFADQLAWLDDAHFLRAWDRAQTSRDHGSRRDWTHAEYQLLAGLAAVQTLINRTGATS